MFLDFLRSKIHPQNPLLLLYHRVTATVAAALYGFPAKNMRVVGVTGTSGKSTTVTLITSILEEVFPNIGSLSSIAIKIKDKILPNDTKMTSFSRLKLNRILAEMKRAGCDTLVIEATSHALTQSRLAGIPVETAVLTNLSGDHVEYHGGFEAYVEAKKKLFERSHRSLRSISVLPSDEPHAKSFEAIPTSQRISYGLSEGAEISTSEISYKPDSTDFILHYGSEKISIHLSLPGKTNIFNALAAASVAYGWGIPSEAVKRGLEKVKSIPGRYESVECSPDQDFTIIVDYAHTPKALEELCAFYRPLTEGRLIIVFGATGGGRDKSKRSAMGEVVSKYCDMVIVTDDDPYEEDRWSIIEQVAAGVKKNSAFSGVLFKILGRREAITQAMKLCHKGDTLILAGKGCEKIWVVGKGKIPWDDREKACEAFKSYVRFDR